jgi:hypothetical protein
MEITHEAITIFVFLIPGFLSSLILNTVVVRTEKDNLSRIVEALVFTFLIYGLVSLFDSGAPVLLNTEKAGETTNYSIHYNSRVVVPTILLSVVLPLLIGRLRVTDKHMVWLRRWKVTEKTSRQTLWEDVFTDQKRYVIVNLSDGRRVFGWPAYFSSTPEEGCIYLQNAAWIVDGKYIDLPIHGLFLVEHDNIDSIEFLNLDRTNAKPKVSEQTI